MEFGDDGFGMGGFGSFFGEVDSLMKNLPEEPASFPPIVDHAVGMDGVEVGEQIKKQKPNREALRSWVQQRNEDPSSCVHATHREDDGLDGFCISITNDDVRQGLREVLGDYCAFTNSTVRSFKNLTDIWRHWGVVRDWSRGRVGPPYYFVFGAVPVKGKQKKSKGTRRRKGSGATSRQKTERPVEEQVSRKKRMTDSTPMLRLNLWGGGGDGVNPLEVEEEETAEVHSLFEGGERIVHKSELIETLLMPKMGTPPAEISPGLPTLPMEGGLAEEASHMIASTRTDDHLFSMLFGGAGEPAPVVRQDVASSGVDLVLQGLKLIGKAVREGDATALLHTFVQRGRVDAVQTLVLAFGVCDRARNADHRTALHIACESLPMHPPIVECLLQQFKEHVREKNSFGQTPLDVALHTLSNAPDDALAVACREVVAILVAAGSPLHLRMVSWIADGPFSVSVALFHAFIRRMHLHMIEAMIKDVRLLQARDGFSQDIALHTACRFVDARDGRKVVELIARGWPSGIRERNAQGHTPLDVGTIVIQGMVEGESREEAKKLLMLLKSR